MLLASQPSQWNGATGPVSAKLKIWTQVYTKGQRTSEPITYLAVWKKVMMLNNVGRSLIYMLEDRLT